MLVGSPGGFDHAHRVGNGVVVAKEVPEEFHGVNADLLITQCLHVPS